MHEEVLVEDHPHKRNKETEIPLQILSFGMPSPKVAVYSVPRLLKAVI